MIRKFYHNGVKTLTVILSVLVSTHFASAQSCGSIDLGSDVEVCSGSSATLTPTENFKLTGNLESLLAYQGVVSNPSNALGAPDGNGAYFCRGNSGKYTGAVWSLPCNLPSGTKLKIRVKVPSGTAYFKVYGAKDNYYYSSNYTLIACKYVSGSSYQDICVTTNGEFNILKIIDKGCSPFKIDAITYEKTCTATYAWSSGETTKSITVSPTETTDYVLTASLCGNTLKDTVKVTVKTCNNGDPICSKVVGNTRGCSNKPYVIWLKDKNGNAHYLSGDSTTYEWNEYANGDAELIAKGLSASGLTGTFDVAIKYAGKTSTPPTNSPKYSNCFTVGSTTGWSYFTSTTGSITSTNYGTMSLTRKGPAAQIGDGANITQDGYGASGWFDISGGTGYITTGDFNVMLDEECKKEKICSKLVSNTRGCSNKPYVIWLKDKNGSAHHLSGDSTNYEWNEFDNGDAQLIATGLSASGLTGTFDVSITFAGKTSTPPTNSPKYSTCFTIGSATGWDYFATTTGTIESSNYGSMSLTRKGPAAQIGDGANITQDGYGASGWFDISGGTGYITTGDFNVMLDEECKSDDPECKTIVGNTRGCAGKPYVIYLVDKHGKAHHLKGDSTEYQWKESTNGDVQFIADDISAPGLSGTFDVDLTFSGATTTPPTNSPKYSSCFTAGSANGWIYFPTTSGTITSTHYGNMTISRQGPAFQLGDGANITQDGFGASGWLAVSGGTGHIKAGDINVMLTEDCENNEGKNRIAGTVFFDADGDTTLGNSEVGEPGVTVYLYDDEDDDGVLDANELSPIDSVLSGQDGTYEFYVDYVCNESYVKSITYQSNIDNPSNMLGKPGADYATYDNDADNLIVELDGTIKDGEEYSIFLRTIETGAYAIISESTDGTNFYHNTNIAILTATSGEYTITADRDVKYIKFDKHAINTISGYNSYGSTSTNIKDYAIHGIEFCNGINSFIVNTDLNTYPDSTELTTDNYEFAQFDGPDQEDVGNDFGFNLSTECDETHTFDPCVVTYGKGSYNNSSTTISISETVSEIKEIVVEGIYKGGKPTAGSFTNGTTSVSWTGSDANALDNVSGTSDKGYYQGTLPAASSVTMNVSNNQSKMHGMAAYVIMKDEFCADNYTSLSDERYYTYRTTNNTTFSMPVTINAKNITAVLPIAEMNNDTRIATFTLTAGGVSESVTINTYDLDRSMTLQTLSLNDVPGNITSATLTMTSPSSNGDSYVTGSAMFNWYLPCETNEGQTRLAGTVFFDADRDTTLDNAEDGQSGVTVYLYDDQDDDGMFDDNELNPIDSVVTGSDGTYEFLVDYVCNEGYIDNVEYQSSIDNPSNLLGEPGNDFATYNNNADNLIVELGGTIKDGEEYSIFLKAIESGAFAIISESTDGVNFYHNTNIAITSSSKGEYTITADRDVNYIKFDKNTINTISGYNTFGSTTTNYADYGIYGVQFCKGINSFLIDTDLTSYPDNTELTTDNYESAQFDGPNQEDLENDYGFNGDVFIDGYVFYDADSSGTFDSGENGTPDITVNLFEDKDCDGVLDVNETTIIASMETNSAGFYSFTRPYEADLSNLPDGLDNCYIIKTDLNDYPANHNLTTDNIEVAEFDGFDQEDLNNNFGHVKNAPLNFCGKIEVTIDKNKVDGDGHENFPVYLDLTHNAFKYRKNWPFSWVQGTFSPNGYDVQVCNADGDELPIEIVGYDSTSGNIKLWVKVPKLSGSENTILTVKHGVSNGTVTNPSSPDVWGSDYKAVYHFEDNNDATSNNNNANNFGSSISSGILGSAVDLDGNDYLQVPYSSSLDITGKKLTMSAWVRLNGNPSSDAPFAVKGPSVNQESYMFGVDGGTNPVKVNSRVTTNNGHYRHDAGSMGVNQWVFVQFVYDGDLGSGQKRVYVNGNLSHTRAASGDINTGNHAMNIGKRLGSDNRYLTGKIDELRIACVATSADWISTEYNNQFSPTTFATITDSSGCGAVPVTWLDFTAKKVSTNDVELDWSTASEINNSHFEVERSFDGSNFEAIGSPIQGAGNTSQIQHYEAMDYDLPEGVAYYRVKQIDFDGQFDYTAIRIVQVLTRNEMVVYPNPANDEVNVSFKGAKGQEAKVTNSMGQELDRIVLSKEGFGTINTTNYPHGVYFIEVQSVSGIETQKFTVRK